MMEEDGYTKRRKENPPNSKALFGWRSGFEGMNLKEFE